LTGLEKAQALRYAIVERHAKSQDERRHPRQSHHAGDSEACLRRLHYAWHNYAGDNPRFRGGMANTMGEAAEKTFAAQLLTEAFGEDRVILRRSVSQLVGLYELRGKIDFMLNLSPKDWQQFFPHYASSEVPVEVKSFRSKGYEDIILRGPYAAHIGQLNSYVILTNAPFGLLMPVQREATEGTPFDLWLSPPNQPRFDLVIARLRKLERWLELDVVPPPMCPAPNKLDGGCPFAGPRCVSDGGWPSRSCAGCGGSLSPLEVGWHARCQALLEG